MSVDQVTPRSRRAILAAALGAAAASVAGALGKPAPTRAANGGPVLLGSVNGATLTTEVLGSGAQGMYISGTTQGVQAQGGSNGIFANATGAHGIGSTGMANNAAGTGRGVFGISGGPDGAGVAGHSIASSVGVFGASLAGAEEAPAMLDQVGVYGYANQSALAKGVIGRAPVGTGVAGSADAGVGVRGTAPFGVGVRGEATTGIGVSAYANTTAVALQVSGRATFTRSGRASVPANQRYVDVTIPGGFVTGTFVIATLQTYRSGVYVAVARNNYPSTGKCRIYLNKVASTSTSTTIGWIAIG